jgi:hypothetical protein
MLLDQVRSEPYFVRGLLRENETRFAVPDRLCSGQAQIALTNPRYPCDPW